MVAATTLVSAATTMAASIAQPIMDVRDLRPGMKGYGLTVFKGTTPEKFDVEILGVDPGAFAGGDMIIAKLSHPLLIDHGVVAGMSGSPVFVDEKLVGAVAYGWGFSVRPIGGVQPIQRMLEVYENITEAPQLPKGELTMRSWPEARAAMQAAFPGDAITLGEEKLRALGLTDLPGTPDSITLQPLMTPLMVGSTSARVLEKARAAFAGTSLMPVAMDAPSVGRTRTTDPNVKMENGSALSVLLVDGDMQMAGVGTATYVEGNRVIGFGHPMFGAGGVDVPMGVAEVIGVIPSLMRPFKLGFTVKDAGALRQDRQPAVGGWLGAKSRMIPSTVTVQAEENKRNKTFNYTIWEDRRLLPMLVFITYLESLDSVRMDGPMTVAMEYTIRLEDGRKLERTRFLGGESGEALFAGFDIAMDLMDLMNNRFEPVRLKSIDTSISIKAQQDLMVLEKVVRPESRYRQGEVVKGQLSYARWRQEPSRIPFEVKIPENLPPGSYEVHLVDGPTRGMMERNFRPELRRAENLDQLLRAMEPSFPTDQLYVLLVDPREDLALGGQRLSALPSTVADTTRATLREASQLSNARGVLVTEDVRRYPAMVMGSAMMNIQVIEKK